MIVRSQMFVCSKSLSFILQGCISLPVWSMSSLWTSVGSIAFLCYSTSVHHSAPQLIPVFAVVTVKLRRRTMQKKECVVFSLAKAMCGFVTSIQRLTSWSVLALELYLGSRKCIANVLPDKSFHWLYVYLFIFFFKDCNICFR